MKNNKKEVLLEFDLPEFEKKDIKIKIGKNRLSIKAEKKQEKKIKREGFFHAEKSYRVFSYSTTLPKINPKTAEIKFEKGKLKIRAEKE
ncbi:MAG: Hsp20 family protein [Candidatus Pacearchaeota archaeon]